MYVLITCNGFLLVETPFGCGCFRSGSEPWRAAPTRRSLTRNVAYMHLKTRRNTDYTTDPCLACRPVRSSEDLGEPRPLGGQRLLRLPERGVQRLGRRA